MKYLSSSQPPHSKQSWLCTNTVLRFPFCHSQFGHSSQLNFLSICFYDWKCILLIHIHLPHYFNLKTPNRHKTPTKLQSLSDLCYFYSTLWLSSFILQAFAVKNSWLTHSFKKKSFVCAWQYFVFQCPCREIFYRLWIV